MTALPQPTVAELATGIQDGDRALLARAITLIESTHPAHQAQAQDLMQTLLADGRNTQRIGITGVPGAGKSTMIDQLGVNLIQAGHRVAVLAVDPTSQLSGGSILGDKTRMNRLACNPNGYVRPSPTSGTLGGVAKKTREAIALLEAAGYDVVIVETVGIGQSEVAVAGMVDFFLVMLLPGSGDELQGIKKGVIELADMVVINKADGEGIALAERSAADYSSALRLLTPTSQSWQPPVLTISALENTGLDQLWKNIEAHYRLIKASGELAERRANQKVSWMHDVLRDNLLAKVYGRNNIMTQKLHEVETLVRDGNLTPYFAAQKVLDELAKYDSP